MAHTYDTKAQFTTGATDPREFAYTCGAGTTLLTLLIVAAGLTQRTGASPTYNGTAFTLGDKQIASAETNVEFWYMLDPPTGASYTIQIQNDNTRTLFGCAASFKAGSGYTSALRTCSKTTGSTAHPGGPTMTSLAAGDVIVSILGTGDNTFAPTAISGTATLYTYDPAAYGMGSQYFLVPSTADKSLTWTEGTAADWATVVASFREVVLPINLVAAEGSQTQGSDAPALTQVHSLGVAEGYQTQLADAPALTQVHVIVPADGVQTQVSDAPAVTQVHVLAVAEGAQTQLSDQATLEMLWDIGADQYVSSGAINLVAAEGAQVQASDSPAVTQVHVLSTAPPFSPAFAAWSSRKLFSLPIPTANLTDFPEKVPIVAGSPASIAIGAVCRADGFDIRFTADDGATELPYERESFAVAGGEATGVFWVKTDVATAGTYIWCYYGNAGASDGADPENVWDANFAAVYHLKDATTSTILDSTANDNDGAKTGANLPIEENCKIGKGQHFNDGTSDRVTVTDDATLDRNATSPLTLSVWVNPDSVAGQDSIICKGDGNFAYNYYLAMGNGWLYLAPATGGVLQISAGSWQHVEVVFDGTDVLWYVNGTLVTTSAAVTLGGANNYPFYIGSDNQAAAYFDGLLDEIRVSSIARSAEWIAYEYANMNPADGGLTWWDEGIQTQASDTQALTQVHSLATVEGFQTQASDTQAVTQVHVLAVAEGAQTQGADSPTVTQVHVLAPVEGIQTQGSDVAGITQVHILAPQEGIQTQVSDNAVLSLGAIPLVPQEGYQEQISDVGSVYLDIALLIHEGFQTQGSDVAELLELEGPWPSDGVTLEDPWSPWTVEFEPAWPPEDVALEVPWPVEAIPLEPPWSD